jgi:hypothetical protein
MMTARNHQQEEAIEKSISIVQLAIEKSSRIIAWFLKNG